MSDYFCRGQRASNPSSGGGRTRPSLLPWERMTRTEMEATIARMKRVSVSAYSLTSVAAMREVLAPLSTSVSTGIPVVDTLLCSSPSTSVGIPNEREELRMGYADIASHDDHATVDAAAAAGGWPVGAVNEVYGPPLSGKTFVLQRTAMAFVRAQCAAQQLQQQQYPSAHHSALYRGVEMADEARENVPAGGSSSAPGWDLFVCLVTPTDVSDAAAATEAWSAVLSPVIDTQPGAMRAYAKEHVHFVTLAHPNELLMFLSWLGDRFDAVAAGSPKETGEWGGTEARRRPSTARPLQRSRHEGSDVLGDEASPREDTEPNADSASVHSPCCSSTSADHESHLEIVEPTGSHHTLLLIDSLAGVWQHPALQDSRHAGAWYTRELVRLLRRLLCRRQAHTVSHRRGSVEASETIATPSGPQSEHRSEAGHRSSRRPRTGGPRREKGRGSSRTPDGPSFPLISTVVLANGSTQFQSVGPQSPSCRSRSARRFPLAGSHTLDHDSAVEHFPPHACAVFTAAAAEPPPPHATPPLFPAGDEHWSGAVDCRLLLTPAHTALIAVVPPSQGGREARGRDSGGGGGGNESAAEDKSSEEGEPRPVRQPPPCESSRERGGGGLCGGITLVPAVGEPMSRACLVKRMGRGGVLGGCWCTIPCEPRP